MTDDEIERMVQEAAELGPMGLDEFQQETAVIRAWQRFIWTFATRVLIRASYTRQAWQAGSNLQICIFERLARAGALLPDGKLSQCLSFSFHQKGLFV